MNTAVYLLDQIEAIGHAEMQFDYRIFNFEKQFLAYYPIMVLSMKMGHQLLPQW